MLSQKVFMTVSFFFYVASHSAAQSATLDRLAHVAAVHRGVYRVCIRHDTLGNASLEHLGRLSRLTAVLVDSSGPSYDNSASLRYCTTEPCDFVFKRHFAGTSLIYLR